MAKRITLISNVSDGSGFDENTLVSDDATAGDAVHIATGTRDEEKWMVRVNGRQVSFSEPLNDGDRVIVTPTKVAGA